MATVIGESIQQNVFRGLTSRALLVAVAFASSALAMTSFAGDGLWADMPSADPIPAQVTYTPITPMNPAQAPAESPPLLMSARPQAPDPTIARTDQVRALLPSEQVSTARIMFNLGLGSPVGLIGGTLTFSP